MSAEGKQVVTRPKKNDTEWAQARKQTGRSMLDYLQRTLCVTLSDGRLLVGRFVAFDPHMNIVLNAAAEYPRHSNATLAAAGREKNKREVGLVVLRGEHVVNVTAVKKKVGATPAAVNAPAGAAAVPGGALPKSSVPQLPKASGARRQRQDDE